MPVYGYVRVSTNDQGNSLLVQKQQIERYYHEYLEQTGEKFAGHYQDAAVSGRTEMAQRRMGRRLNLILRKGDTVVCSKLDRAFRNFHDLVFTVDNWNKRGVRFVLLDMRIDTSTHVGALMLQMMGAFAEFERKRISERVKEATFAIRKSKIYHGYWYGGTPPMGWKTTRLKDGTIDLIPDEQERENIRAIQEKFKELKSVWLVYGWLLGTKHRSTKKICDRTGKPQEYTEDAIRRFVKAGDLPFASKPPKPVWAQARKVLEAKELDRIEGAERAAKREEMLRRLRIKDGARKDVEAIVAELANQQSMSNPPGIPVSSFVTNGGENEGQTEVAQS